MDIGVGLPSHLPGARRSDIVAWARRAEDLGFASVVVTDRFAYNQLEPLSVLAVAGAVTERIRLRTSVMVLPNRGEAAPLAKQLASLQVLMEGRLEIGVGVGDRDLDYRLAGAQHRGRHRRLEVMLEEMRAVWAGRDEYELVGPRPPASGVPVMIGGSGPDTWRRVAQLGTGWTFAIGSPDDFAAGAQGVMDAWEAWGRAGRPRLASQRYFNLGSRRREQADQFLRTYFAFLGPYVDLFMAGTPLDAKAVGGVAEAFRQAGADELAFLPASADLDELEELAELLIRPRHQAPAGGKSN
jgi:alkanesulfonate monooxygenase SsuD/methylene tetrahydromethanopterin reductase-like flavin-dependent oxidoreductase (luciferase family)